MSQQQKYECGLCGAIRWVPESPVTGEQEVDVLCEDGCGRYGPHYAVSRAAWAMKKDGLSRARAGRGFE
jgi:hypothetical protein